MRNWTRFIWKDLLGQNKKSKFLGADFAIKVINNKSVTNEKRDYKLTSNFDNFTQNLKIFNANNMSERFLSIRKYFVVTAF